MQVRIAASILFALSIALALFAIPVHAQNTTGRIEGQLTNGTRGARAESVQNLQVRLFGIDVGAAHPVSATTQSDIAGKFSFSNLDTTATTKYLLTTNYGGVDYFSDALAFDANQTNLPTTMTIYETTTDASVLQVMQTHLIFDVRTRFFNIVQIIVAQNSSDRTLLPTQNRATLLLPILPGAQNVQFSSQEADQTTLRGDGVMTYTLPFAPGSDQIVYTYAIPFTPPTFQLNLKMPFDSARVRVLLPDVGATISSAQLAPSSPFQAQGGQRYLLSTVENVRSGTALSATFANLPSAVADSTRPSNQSEPLVAGLVLGISALLAGALLIYPFARRRKMSEGA